MLLALTCRVDGSAHRPLSAAARAGRGGVTRTPRLRACDDYTAIIQELMSLSTSCRGCELVISQ